MALYTAHPLVFLDESEPDNGGCVIPSNLWSQWSTEITDLMLVKIKYDETEHILHVQSFHKNGDDTIYIPSWCFSQGVQSEVTMERVEEMPPVATKITLQPLDTEVYHCDISSTVSEYLSNWQVLSVGTTLTVPCPELGGFLVDFYVKSIEPAPTVLLRGEVPLELDEPIETVAEWVKKTGPPPQPPIQDTLPMIEPSVSKTVFVPFSGKGYSLR